MSQQQSVLRNRWVRAAIGLLSFAGVVVLAWLLRPVLVPLFFAFIAAYVLDPIVDYFEKHGVRRMITTLSLAVLGLAALFSIPYYLLTGVMRESQELVQIAQTRMKNFNPAADDSRLNEWLHKLPLDEVVEMLGWEPEPGEKVAGVEVAPPAEPTPEIPEESGTLDATVPVVPEETPETAAPGDTVETPVEGEEEAPVEPALSSIQEPEPNYDPLAVILDRIGTRIQEDAIELLKNYGARTLQLGAAAGTNVAGVMASAGKTAVGVLLAIGNFVLFAFVAGYLLRDYDRIIAAADDLVPPARRARVRTIMTKIDNQLRGFMRGQALVCLFLGTFYAIGLSIAQVPFGAVIGILGGAASFIPYLGISLTILPATILCVVQQGGVDWHLFVVAGTFIFAQMLESTVVTPKVVGTQVGLGPVWVILAILVFGNALGLLGLLLAVPSAAALKVLIGEALQAYRQSRFYRSVTVETPPASVEIILPESVPKTGSRKKRR